MANELILIVEDNPKNLKPVRDTLQVKGVLSRKRLDLSRRAQRCSTAVS
jgi:hypothetical protein